MPDDIEEIDSSHIEKHPPSVDIDQYVPNSNFRIERMSEDSVWVAALTEDDDEPDHHYHLSVTDEGGLQVTHRQEEAED